MQGVHNLGNIQANGAEGNSGASPVSGGNGGTIAVLSQYDSTNAGPLEANGGAGGASTGANTGGKGGNGGLIAFGYKGTLINTGDVSVNGAPGGNGTNPGSGGNGGLAVFSGNGNPIGNGNVNAIGRPGGNNNLFLGGKAGTIVAPNPGTLGQTQTYFQQGYDSNGHLGRNLTTQQTQPVELLTHAENLIMLTKNGGSSSAVSDNLFTRLTQARIRSVEDPTSAFGQARQEVFDKNTASSPYVYRNLILSSSRDNLALNLTHPYFVEAPGAPGALIFPSALSRGEGFSTLNTLTLLNNGSIQTQTLPGPYSDSSYQPTNFWLIGRNSNPLAGGRISALASDNISNDNIWGTTGVASGGSIHIATQGSFYNNANLGMGSPQHGGSMLMKAGRDIVNDETIYYSIGQMNANGGVMGGTIRILPKNDFNYTGGVYETVISANGSLQGGIIGVNAGHDSIFDSGPFFLNATKITVNGTSPTLGRGGFIHLHAANNNTHNGTIEATGGLEDGTVLFTTGN